MEASHHSSRSIESQDVCVGVGREVTDDGMAS
jgi:hypothetical protein